MEYIDSKYFSYADPDDPYLKRLIIRTIESLSGQPELYKLYNEYQRSPELYRNFWEGSIKKLNLNVNFSEEAMKHICRNSSVFYLKVKFEKILERVRNFDNRGFIKDSDQTFEQAFQFREHLYEKYADHVIDNEDSTEVCLKKIEELLEN